MQHITGSLNSYLFIVIYMSLNSDMVSKSYFFLTKWGAVYLRRPPANELLEYSRKHVKGNKRRPLVCNLRLCSAHHDQIEIPFVVPRRRLAGASTCCVVKRHNYPYVRILCDSLFYLRPTYQPLSTQ